jgi:tetratricopeptide (TPR) repeat protein
MVKVARNPTDNHDFHTLGSKVFEQFCCDLHRHEDGVVSTNLYAPDGQKQFGIDHVAFRSDGNVEVGQSKAYQRCLPAQITKAADEFLEHVGTKWQDKRVTKFILFVACAVKSAKACDEILAQAARFKDLGIDFALYSEQEIYARLSSAQGVVRTYLGHEFVEKLFGKPGAHFVELTQQVISGNSQALQTTGILSRLNQASSHEVLELRRKARRGEVDAVIVHLEEVLRNSAASDALSSENKSEMLRLLAGLLIGKDEFSRAKELLDLADAINDTSAKLRALLALESVGPEAALLFPEDDESGVCEVKAVAHLRIGDADAAIQQLEVLLHAEEVSAETLRLAAICELVRGNRDQAVDRARAAVAADSDMRACKQALGIALFNRALSPSVAPQLGEWPQPIDLSLVYTSGSGKQDMEEALGIFQSLSCGSELSGNQSMISWHSASLACLPDRREEAAARIQQLAISNPICGPAIAWGLSSGLQFDTKSAAAGLDHALQSEPQNFEVGLIRIALANFMRDRKRAGEVLMQIAPALEESGNAKVVAYWQAVLDIDARMKPSTDTVQEYPWLALRWAMTIRKKGKRLSAVADVLAKQIETGGDAAVAMACAQILFDNRRNKKAALALPLLINEIATPDALGLAAHIAHAADDFATALDAVAKYDAIFEGDMPFNLKRIHVEALASTGQVLEARQAGLQIAIQTKRPEDMWRAIHLQLVTGDTSAAFATYNANSSLLKKPTAGHIHLARALHYTNPHAASKVASDIWNELPDDLVPAAFDLANRFRLSGEQQTLVGRLHQLGASSSSGIQLVTVDEIVAMMNERRKRAEEAIKKHRDGHLPIHAVAQFLNGGIVGTHLAPHLLDDEAARDRAGIVARYGRRYDNQIWPKDRTDLTIYVDVTALLTAHAVGMLERVEQAFSVMTVAADTLTTIDHFRADIDVAQPERIDAMREVLKAVEDGQIEVGASGHHFVAWEEITGEPSSEAPLNFPRLIEAVANELRDEESLESIRSSLGTTLSPAPQGSVPEKGSSIMLQAGIAVTLAAAGTLGVIATNYKPMLSSEEVAQIQNEVANAELRARLVASLTALHRCISIGLSLGKYRFVPTRPNQSDDPLMRSIGQLVGAMQEKPGILWIDDRFITAFPQFNAMSSLEVIHALVNYNQISNAEGLQLRQKIRKADWLFMPIEAEELTIPLRAATSGGRVNETSELRLLRRSIALTLYNRRLIQWPNPNEINDEIKGEVPHLFDNSHSLGEALALIWKNPAWTTPDAKAASQWLIENIDINLFPYSVIAEGDPRSDHLLGVHLGGLALNGLQVLPSKQGRMQLKAFLEWLWDAVIAETLKVRPESTSSLVAMIEGHITSFHFELEAQDLERKMAGNFIDSMPARMRELFMDRPKVREYFGLPDHHNITIGNHDFDEREFWTAVATCSAEKSRELKSVKREMGHICIANDASDLHISVIVGEDRLRLDPWPTRISDDRADIRLSALKSEPDEFDLSDSEFEAFNQTLQLLTDPADRIMRTISKIRSGSGHWYSEFARSVRDRIPFQVWEITPESLHGVAHLLRVEANDLDLQSAIKRLVADRGLETAISRLSSLPIRMPAELINAIEALPATQADELLARVVKGNPKPWVCCFAARLVAGMAQPSSQLQESAKAWLITAASGDAIPLWELYREVAQFACNEFAASVEWSTLTPTQRLAICWFHAAQIARTLVDGQVATEPFIEILRNHRRLSPRMVLEDFVGFGGDTADPRQTPLDRLRMFELAEPLLHFSMIAPHDEMEMQTAIRGLLIEQLEDKENAKLSAAQNGLASGDLLQSIFCADFSELIGRIVEGSSVLCGNGLRSMLTALLSEDCESPNFKFSWTMLRIASGDVALPKDLAELAYARSSELRFDAEVEDVRIRRISLLTFTTLAANNGWLDKRDVIDEATKTLYPPGSVELDSDGYYFEQSLWRARMEATASDVARHLANAIENYAVENADVETPKTLLRTLAASFSGQQSEAFIDSLAALCLR